MDLPLLTKAPGLGTFKLQYGSEKEERRQGKINGKEEYQR